MTHIMAWVWEAAELLNLMYVDANVMNLLFKVQNDWRDVGSLKLEVPLF